MVKDGWNTKRIGTEGEGQIKVSSKRRKMKVKKRSEEERRKKVEDRG